MVLERAEYSNSGYIHTLGINSRRRDGEITKSVKLKAAVTGAKFALYTGLFKLLTFISVVFYCFVILCKLLH